MFFGRIASLFVILAIIASCGWLTMQVRQLNQEAIAIAPTVSAYHSQATAVILEAKGNYNYDNAAATAVIIDSEGTYILHSAQATAIVADSNQGPVNIYKDGISEGREQGLGAAFGLSFMGLMGVLVVVVLILLARR